MVRRSISPHRNHLRSAVCNPLAGDSQGTRPSIWSDLLATIGRMVWLHVATDVIETVGATS